MQIAETALVARIIQYQEPQHPLLVCIALLEPSLICRVILRVCFAPVEHIPRGWAHAHLTVSYVALASTRQVRVSPYPLFACHAVLECTPAVHSPPHADPAWPGRIQRELACNPLATALNVDPARTRPGRGRQRVTHA